MPLHTFIHRLVVTDRQMSTHLMFNPSYFKSVPLIQKGVFILWEEQAVFLNILEYIHSITKYYKQIHHGLGGLRPCFRSDVRVQLEHNTNRRCLSPYCYEFEGAMPPSHPPGFHKQKGKVLNREIDFVILCLCLQFSVSLILFLCYVLMSRPCGLCQSRSGLAGVPALGLPIGLL